MIIIYIVSLFFQVYTWLLIARIIGSWFPQLNQYQAFRFIVFYTDPYLNVFRQIIPPLGMFDLSPIVAFLCLGVIEKIIIALLVMILT